MKKLALSCLLLAFLPWQAKALVPVADQTDLLSYVAMPLAVSSVCDVRGVQTDRVGQLVTYMDQANVPPAAFDDVFRYVPVALVMRTDRRPDFVEWVHGQVVQGVNGPALVTAMETQLGTYGTGITVVSNRYPARYRRHHRRYGYETTAYAYDDYAYRDAFADDYVPVVVRRYCEREIVEPLALVDMPVAVADVYGLGVPVARVSSLAVELNIGGVPPLQFVELFRYAPAALVVDTAYAPDFVSYVHTQEVAGVYGLPLVQAIDQQLPVYGVNAQIDLTSPGYYYSPDNYYVPNYAPTAPQFMAQYYVPPADPAYVPPVVQTRIASGFAASGANFALPQQTAPAIAAPQVQRLLNAQNGNAVVTNPTQARREIAQENRAARRGEIQAPGFAAAQAPQMMVARGHGRGRSVTAAPATVAPMVAAQPQFHGNGHGRGNQQAMPVMAAPQTIQHGNGHGRGRAVTEALAFARPPQVIQQQPQFHGNGNGHGRRAVMQQAPPVAAPAPVMAAPQVVQHGHGNGHGGGQPVMVAPQPAPAAVVAPQQQGGGNGHVPPGQEKKKGKDH